MLNKWLSDIKKLLLFGDVHYYDRRIYFYLLVLHVFLVPVYLSGQDSFKDNLLTYK